MENKTKDEILDSEFATQMEPGMVRDGVIKAMELYATQQSDKAVEAYKNRIKSELMERWNGSYNVEAFKRLIDSTPIR
jgi:hypothetical protein